MGLLSEFAQRVESGVDTLRRIIETPDRMDAADERMDLMQAENQQYLDDLATQLSQAGTAIDARLDALENKVAAGETLDFSELREVASHLTALGQSAPDTSTPLPDAPPVITDPVPTDPSTPVDTTPVDPGAPVVVDDGTVDDGTGPESQFV